MPAWGYEFTSALSLDQLSQRLNAAGPWVWQLRESHWYGEYLNTRPRDGLRVRIHMPPDYQPEATEGENGGRYVATVNLEASDAPTVRETAQTFRDMLLPLCTIEPRVAEPLDD